VTRKDTFKIIDPSSFITETDRSSIGLATISSKDVIFKRKNVQELLKIKEEGVLAK
jgi:hypothetical protein